ncbi:fibronectin-like [Lytechinus variegatus]|uniref:fibronectin-like n=1 Tax=Lytechinus variegatus TaxID=7654 RepID=UPI001BB1B0EA|nr:fibronectin-like [Lytechinus variegatus]
MTEQLIDRRPASVENLQMSPATTHIDVTWVVSSSISAPDYFILRYSLYRKLACPSPETTIVQIEVNTTSTLYRLDGLEPYSTYKISVIAVNSIGESEPTTRIVDTGAGRPAAIRNVMVNPERTSPTRLAFTWEPLNCRNVNGEFWYYYPRIYADGDKTMRPDGAKYLDSDLTSSSVEFNELEPCTMYELNINAGTTDREAGELSRANGLTSVTFTSASTFGYQNMISVSWSVPSGCEVDYYRLSYQLSSRRACPDVPVIDSEVNELNVTSPPYTSVTKNIPDLENYATYNISIIAVIDGIESLPRSVQGNTVDGKPSAIESVSYTSTAHSLTFEWEEPSCENLHGNLNEYEINFVYSRRTARQTLSREENSLTFTDLIGCTEYTFTIRLVTATNYRSEWYAITANISEPGEPNINEIRKHREEGATGLIVHWDPPTPPCEPTHYQIQYYIYQGDMCEDIPGQPQLGLTSAGSVNGSTFTFTILELRPNSEYMVFVRAQTSSGYGDSDSQRALTGHSYPSGPPTNVHSTGTKKRSITFTWDKPACGYRNGPITSYDVILFDSTGGVVDQRNVSDSTAPEATIDGLNPYSNYSIGVRAWNYELPGVYSPKVWAQTDEAKPGPPIGVNIPASHQESITVEWMSPNPPLGRIIGYYVLYWETDDSSVTPVVRNVSFPCGDGLCSDINQRFSVIIPDLRPDTNYSIQVVAETSLGVGDPSPDHPLVRLTSEKTGVQVLPVVLGITLAGAVLTLMIVGVFYYRRRRTSVFSRLSASFRTRENTPIYAIPDNQNGNQDRSDEYMPLKHIQSQRSHDALPTIPSSEALYEDIDAVPEVGTYANMPSVENTHAPIVLDQLITYVTQKTNSESGFKEDFQASFVVLLFLFTTLKP